jgi:hypothetical protein
MANTGYKNWLTLKKYINGVATEETKANDVSDPDYIAPVLDLTACPTPSNTCPQIDSAISDINVIVGASDTTIDLTTVFSDSDGDTLSYIATSSNSAGVSATISGTNLIISYLSATSASSNISVTASDGTCSAVDSFTVTISATTSTTTTTTAAPTFYGPFYFGRTTSAVGACTYYPDITAYWIDDPDFENANELYLNSSGSVLAGSDWYSDGTIAQQWDGTAFVDAAAC